VADGMVPRPDLPSASPHDCRPVHWDVDTHHGSADLEEWPPSFVEMYWAQEALGGSEADASEHLREVALTTERVYALLRNAMRRNRANRIAERVALR
jgi:hypothetical protein